MGKKFSVLDMGDEFLVLSGFIDKNVISELPDCFEKASGFSKFETFDIEIFHLVFLDDSDSDTDLSIDALEKISENIAELQKNGLIKTVALKVLTVAGLADEEIIEVGDL